MLTNFGSFDLLAVYRFAVKMTALKGKLVAMKIMSIDKDDHKGLRDELKILKTCKSSYTVDYVASFIKGDKFWIAMEYCAAGSVLDLMAYCQMCLTEEEVAICMKHALMGLSVLHKKKIIHRDIKAANLLLTEEGDCKLADFGVSKKLTHTLARTMTMIGTPYWMAPEVVCVSIRNESLEAWMELIRSTCYDVG